MARNVLVIGYARSGAAVARLLVNEGATVTVSDPQLDLEDSRVIALQDKGVTFTTEQGNDLLENVDVIVKNPGIPYSAPILAEALHRGIPTEVEVVEAQKYITGNWIAITGSNGKTTTTEMIAAVMRSVANERHKVVVAGNIGTPVSEVALSLTPDDTLITELSSFQLWDMPTAHPHFAVVTNIFASHLNWHADRQEYIDAKMNITKNQTADDYLLMNWDTEEWRELAQRSQAQIIPISREANSKDGAYEQDGVLYFRDEAVMQADQLGVPGEHNIENALVAIAIGRLNGVPAKLIADVLEHFSGVEHRLQFVREYAGRQIYNDSKATDIEATQKALSGFKTPVVLLAGGLERGDELQRLAPDFQQHVRALVTFGQTGPRLAKIADEIGLPNVAVESAQTAFATAFDLSEAGDVILLSPAAASWDQFPNFETRGALFVKSVEDFIKAKEQ